MSVLIASLLLLQAGEAAKIADDFHARRERARTVEETRTLAGGARDKLDALVKSGREVAAASFHAGEMCLVLDDLPGALSRLKAAITASPPLPKDLLGSARFMAGELSLQEGDAPGARTFLADFVANHAGDERTWLARMLVEVTWAVDGQAGRALEGLAKLRDEHKGRPPEWPLVFTRASVAHFAERPDDARAALEEIVRDCPEPEATRTARATLEMHRRIGQELKLAGRDPDGREVDLAKLRGQVVIVYVTSMFEERAPLEVVVVRRALQAAGRDATAVAVCLDRRAEDLERFRKDMGVTWPVLHEPGGYDGPLAVALGARTYPHLLVLDRKGRIRFFNPFITPGAAELRVLVAKLVAEK